MAKLINDANVSGSFRGITVTDVTQLVVELSALEITKTADKLIWLDNDPLTYTVRVTNVDPDIPAEAVTAVIFTDTIDPAIAALDTSSVTLDGATLTLDTDFTYDADTGLLTLSPIASINPGVTVEISFRVNKI